jgi:hypothetical protein
MMNIQWVMLQRWQELRAHATATNQVWPLSASLATEFERFSAALTFSFRGSTLAPQFLQKKVMCDLPCFAKQLGLRGVKTPGAPLMRKSDDDNDGGGGGDGGDDDSIQQWNSLSEPPQPLHPHYNRTLLFVDDHHILYKVGAARQLHPMTRHTPGVAVLPANNSLP